jgi:hypothetical protein
MRTNHSFGRLVDHDIRSRSFAHEQKLARKTVLWAHHAPVLDQGRLGSCTGNALAQCLNSDYFAPVLEKVNKGQPLLEYDAVGFYSLATKLDGIPGNTYPPKDGGSSGLGVCKAGKKLGYLTAYRHCFSFTSFLSALQTQPLIVGTEFYAGMEDPDKTGFVKPTGDLLGGHEYVALGVDYGLQQLTFLNSWGKNWGVNGRFRMSFESFETLLSRQGDATIPIGAA